MTLRSHWVTVVLLLAAVLSQRVLADCVVAEESKQLDPVEVGFCESDAVFIGKSEGAIETIGGVTEAGSETKHFRIQRSTVRVVDLYKAPAADKVADKVTMIADLYAKEPAYVFEAGRTYLIFAKRLKGDTEYAGAVAACSVQPTLPIADAKGALKQLEQHKNGQKVIDCTHIRPKAKT
jgi:hypothetical protein